jgi:cytochrome c
MKRVLAGLVVAMMGLLGWGVRARTVQAAPDEAANPEFYTTKVQPIFQANCYRCHGGMNHRGGLNIQTRAGMLKGGHEGPVLIPGDPVNSLLVRLIRHEGPPNADIATVERWVKAGAIMPQDTPQ